MSESRLSIRNLTVRFGGLTAVDRVGLDIQPNELIGIIGPNGAGKTTFFNAISGVVVPSEGCLVMAGTELAGRPPHIYAEHGIARTFQTPRVFSEMTVGDNVRFGFQFAGRRRARHRATLTSVSAILEFVGLGREAAQAAREITPARQRLLEIGMALGTRPQIVLLDEVSAGLMEAELEAMARLVRRLRDELHLTVVWIEHAVSVLFRTVDRVVVLHQGAVIADGTPRYVTENPAVVEAYLGDTGKRSASGGK